jgi:hypothetical protein
VVEPVKLQSMVAGTMHLISLVDSQVGSLVSELDDSISFLCA